MKAGENIVSIKVGGKKVHFQVSNKITAMRADTLLTKEPDTIAWIDRFPPDTMFWDVGANVGVYSLYAAIIAGARVLAFEPGSPNYQLLNRNIQINKVSDQVSALCLCLSDQSKIGSFYMHSIQPGDARHSFGAAVDYKGEAFAPRFVQGTLAVTVDDMVQRFGAPAPTALKIDVDGIEPQILLGGRQVISNPAFRTLLVETTVEDDKERDFIRAFAGQCGLTEDTSIPSSTSREIGGIHMANMIFNRP